MTPPRWRSQTTGDRKGNGAHEQVGNDKQPLHVPFGDTSSNAHQETSYGGKNPNDRDVADDRTEAHRLLRRWWRRVNNL